MKKKFIFLLFSLFAILSLLVVRFSKYYSIACENYAEIGIKSSITMDINEVLSKELEKISDDCKNILSIKYNKENEITAIEIDSGRINHISNDISTRINETLIDRETTYGIPLGNTLGLKILSGIGPKIRVKVIPIGAVSYEIKSEIISGGINQTIYRIAVEYQTEIKCLSPFEENIIPINTSVVFAETLIVGKVPDWGLSSLK